MSLSNGPAQAGGANQSPTVSSNWGGSSSFSKPRLSLEWKRIFLNMGMEVVTAHGEVIWLGSKCVKDVAGYTLKDLFIGSEGTLGIVTKVLLKLLPRPKARKTMLATYDSMDALSNCNFIIESICGLKSL